MRSTFLILPLLFVLAACSDGGGTSMTNAGLLELPDDGSAVYLALGDSIAAGTGTSDAETTGYPALLAAALRERAGVDVELVSLAAGGATTEDALNEQVPAALDRIAQGDVRLVTLTIGGNDLNVIEDSPDGPACIEDVRSEACPVQDVLVGTAERLDAILSALRGADEDLEIVVQIYPNLFSGTGHLFEVPAEQSFGLLDEVIVEKAGQYGARTADPRVAFKGNGPELTHILDAEPDFHPNDAGYEAIAAAFLEALGVEG